MRLEKEIVQNKVLDIDFLRRLVLREATRWSRCYSKRELLKIQETDGDTLLFRRPCRTGIYRLYMNSRFRMVRLGHARVDNLPTVIRQGPVVELLTRWKAEIDSQRAVGALCEAASMYVIKTCVRVCRFLTLQAVATLRNYKNWLRIKLIRTKEITTSALLSIW